MKDLKDKVAVVTGGASGIGLAMAERFAKAGMKIALVDIEADALAKTAKALESSGAEVLAERIDVSDAAEMERLREAVLSRFGAVHLVCNNAGVAAGGATWELTLADWEFTMGPNLWGVIHGVRVFAPLLVDQNEGHIVNTASMAGLVSAPGMAPYNVTKYGVVALSETLYADLAEAGSEVGVSVLCPGFVRSQIWNSDRNRPEHLRNPVEASAGTESTERREMLRKIIENAMPAEQIAERVLEAVLAKRLYILTHESTLPVVERRMRHILEGSNPTLPATGPEQLAR